VRDPRSRYEAAATLLGAERPFGSVAALWQIFGIDEEGGEDDEEEMRMEMMMRMMRKTRRRKTMTTRLVVIQTRAADANVRVALDIMQDRCVSRATTV
jgi:hypothetical protein